MIRRLVGCTAILTLVLAASGTVGSTAADQTARIKTPKGLKDNMEIAGNPNGDVLFVYDSGGKVFAALAKPSGTGKYKGKKAKAVSSGDGERRPTGVFDVNANEYLVSWDTGPESLRTASAATVELDPSDILSRRLKAKTGKGFKSVIETVSDGLMNFSPLLMRSAADDIELFFTTADPATARVGSVRPTPSSTVIISMLLAGDEISNRELDELEEDGLISTKWIEASGGHYCIVITVLREGNATAQVANVPATGPASWLDSTPGQFPSADTTAAALARLAGGKLISWKEGGVTWVEARNDNGNLIKGPQPLPQEASRPSNTIRSGDQNRAARPDHSVFIATQGGDGMAHLLEYDDSGALVNNRALFAHKNDMSSLRLIALPEGRALLAWIKAKNKNNDQIWIHVFDL